MKFKKAMATATAAIVAFTMGATALTACDKGCDHQFRWTVTTPATCISEGEQEGLCGLCGYVDTQVIPISDKHAFGEWEIEKPTETKQGKAVKVCSLSEEHTLEVTLPVLTENGEGYTSSKITVAPSAIADGERTFVLSHAEGDISFTVTLPPTGIESVSDAVEVAATKAELIRSVSGRTFIPGGGSGAEVLSNYSYEFGDNYTHITNSGDRTEYWCSLDEDGNIYAVKRQRVATEDGEGYTYVVSQDTSASNDLMNGYGFIVAYSGLGPYYGVESFLSSLYELAHDARSQDFSENLEQKNGNYVYNFSFGYVNGRFFNEISVTFTLTPYGAVNTFELASDVYAGQLIPPATDDGSGDNGETAQDDDTDSGEEATYGWTLDENGKAVKLTDTPNGTERISATTIMRDSEEGAIVPENPYNKNDLQIKGFDISYNNSVITDEQVINITATSGTSGVYEFKLVNLQNNGVGTPNINYDPVSVYRRIGNVDTPVSFELTVNSISALVSGTSIKIRSHVVGDITLAVKTQSGSVTRLINLHVNYAAPSALYPSVYEYGDAGYVWNDSCITPDSEGAKFSFPYTTARIYAGQELLVMAKSPAEESAYTKPEVTAILQNEDMDAVTGDFYTLEADGAAYKFSCSQAGTYLIRLYLPSNVRVQTTIVVTVENPPAITTVLAGTYTCRLDYPQYMTATVTFTVGSEFVTVSDVVQGTETLRYTWDGEKLVTTHYDGAELGYSITLNEVYKPVLSHPTGYGTVESVVLQRPV